MIEYKRIFLDTAPLIYFLEGSRQYGSVIEYFFDYCRKNAVELFTSVVTVEEYLVHPFAQNDIALVTNFKAFLIFMDIRVLWIDALIAEHAAHIRAQHRSFKAMDALQLASTQKGQCEAFLTNDKALLTYDALFCLLVDSLDSLKARYG